MNSKANSQCLFVITGAYQLTGGIAAANRLAIQACIDVNMTIDIIALNENDEAEILYRDREVASYHAANNSKIKFIRHTWQKIINHPYEFIFCDHVNLAAMLFPLKFYASQKYIVRLNGIELFPPNWEGTLGLFGAWKRLSISDFTRDKIQKRFSSLEIQTVDLSLSPSLSHDLSLDNSIKSISMANILGQRQKLEDKVILIVGRMALQEQYKGHDVLIQAMSLIVQKHPDAQLVMAGKGDDMPRLLKLAQKLSKKIKRRIYMPGFVSDELLQELYKLCYVFAMPSRGEGFGLVYLEAMRYAKPCIGSHKDASACIIQHDRTGFLIKEPTDPREVADKLLTLLDQPEQAKAMGQAGYELLCNYYLYPHFKERFLNAIR